MPGSAPPPAGEVRSGAGGTEEQREEPLPPDAATAPLCRIRPPATATAVPPVPTAPPRPFMIAAPPAPRGTPPGRPAASWAAASRRGGSAAGGAAGGRSAPSGAARRGRQRARPEGDALSQAGCGEPVTVAFVGGMAARALSVPHRAARSLRGSVRSGARRRPRPRAPSGAARPAVVPEATSERAEQNCRAAASLVRLRGRSRAVTWLPAAGGGSSRGGPPRLLFSAVPRAGRLPRRFFPTASKSAFTWESLGREAAFLP